MTTIHSTQIQFAKMHIGKTTPSEESTVYNVYVITLYDAGINTANCSGGEVASEGVVEMLQH